MPYNDPSYRYINPGKVSPSQGEKITLRRQARAFRDVSLDFEAHPITKDLTILRNERAINNAIRNIIYMYPLEVPFQRDIGSKVGNYLFDIVDEGTAGLLNLEIRRAIQFNEPRVEIQEVVITPKPDENEFACRIDYKIVGYEQVFVVEEILTPTR